MTPNEAAELLAHASSFDNRQPSLAAATAWASALDDVPLDADAKAAVAAYYTTPPQNPNERLWILPHHIRTLRSKIRSARLVNFQYEPIPDETVGEFMARLRGQTQAIASGRVPAPVGRLALEADPKRDREFVKELEARGWEGNRAVPGTDEEAEADTVRRAGPLSVECPTCRAALGHPCKSPGASAKRPLGKPRPKPHSARLRAAQGVPEQTAAQRAAEEQAVKARAAQHFARNDGHIHDADIIEEPTP
ncbi:hypothetical protein [Streptomyces caniscabiei]|uniref:zinc finger domain-containing protein n=1 Tax=Streptomyces caniscabiei TaxID=2746961 RepID=UPI001872411C|nr:hypothetical protein [Streptomyces caniscabiei]MBE4796168.1 hypothetical protein [Streptomyces caniscabiei]MDX2944476.1 hypothetical protein [Streptomyces caniscabiei]